MSKNILLKIFLVMGLLFSYGCGQVWAKTVKYNIKTTSNLSQTSVRTDSLYDQEQFFDNGALVTIDERNSITESLFPDKSIDLSKSHFTWGAEFGSSIDMSARNMSTFDVDVNLGYKNAYFKVIGVGAGFHRGISSGINFIPLYLVIRTSFRKKPSLFFLNAQAGYSFSRIPDQDMHGDLISALGLGINLTQSRHAKSYIILSAVGRYFDKKHQELTGIDASSIIMARLQIGINF